MMLAPFQALNFTGMGGPMGVYEPYDTDACDPGGTHCVARDNEAFYVRPGRTERTPSEFAAARFRKVLSAIGVLPPWDQQRPCCTRLEKATRTRLTMAFSQGGTMARAGTSNRFARPMVGRTG
jgi:hypothetical protein